MSTHYVSNSELLDGLIEYGRAVRKAHRNNLPKPVLPDYIGLCFLKIAERLSRKSNFSGYTFREDMVSDAVENCLLYVDNFDPKKSSNPFAYFTQIIYYAFLRRILREKKHLYVKYKLAEEQLIHHHNRLLDDDGMKISPDQQTYKLYENITDFIQTFEKTHHIKFKRKRGLERFLQESE